MNHCWLEVSIDNLIDEKSRLYETCFIKYTPEDLIEEKQLENPGLFKTPIVRNGKLASIEYKLEIWKTWE